MADPPSDPSSPDAAEKRQKSLDLLNQTHQFPQPVLVKVIGHQRDSFVDEVLLAVQAHLQLSSLPPSQTRETAGGRHVAVSLEPPFESAEQVLSLYEELRQITGVVMLL